MRKLVLIAIPLLIAGCGRSQEERLEEAADQSYPAAAEVLNAAAENGMNAQEALDEAGEAAVRNMQSDNFSANLRARPNTAEQPNPPRAGQPVEQVPANRIEPPGQR